jgi:putative DNA primase/helicase
MSVFANEHSRTPLKSGILPWPSVVAMHSQHAIRDDKSGPMVASYSLNGTRNNNNVFARSYLQADVDSEGEKQASGRLLRVTRSAPDFAIIKSIITELEWVANSTHWHEPSIGANKYRISVLTDRDYLFDEHKPLLEALDELLGGCLDRAAWAWSQAFFTPSCPPHATKSAFVVHNQGVPLPVDEFVARGRQIIADREQLPAQPTPNVSLQPAPPETLENVQTVQMMLAAIPADVDRATWLRILLAVHSLAWSCGEKLARDWSQTCPAKWSPRDFSSVWSSYDPTRPDAVGYGTLTHLAHAHGYVGPAPSNAQFDGKGADVANGKLFAQLYRNKLLHIHETGDWLQFDVRAGWLKAGPRQEEQAAKAVVEHLRADAARQLAAGVEEDKVRKLLRHIEYSSRAPNLRAMIDMAKSEPGMTRRAGEFDADPMLLGLCNGVLDLRTGQLRTPSPDLLVSKRCNVAYDPAAPCPQFEQFMLEIQPGQDEREFLQRLAGYCLTGDASAQAFAFLFGTGCNGKSVYTETMAWLLGDYARKIATEMLMQHQRNPQGPSPDIVALKGVRLAYASETEEGQRFAAARIKELTGGDTLSGRVPYGKADICFQPTHKLLIVGNHKPEISDMSHGMWRRVMLVGFEQTIPAGSRDPHLLEKLKGEGAAILNWAFAGLQAWRQSGLQMPRSVQDATTAYRDDQDILGDWLRERCHIGPTLTAAKRNVYLDYLNWAQANGHAPMSKNRLSRRLDDRGCKPLRDKRTVTGLTLKYSNPFEAGA